MIPAQKIDEIKEKVDIVDVVGEYVQLKKAGHNFSGLCPFHEEKTPSFSVSEDKQIFKCFGCGKGGSVFNFIQDIEGLSFPEAVKWVADYAHVPLDFQVKVESPRQKNRQRLIQIHEKTQEIYQHLLLNTQVGSQPLAYLLDRGLSEEIIKHFGLGYAPDNGKFLLEILTKEGYQEEELQNSGLFTGENGLFDRFQGRIMFPLENPKGELVGFSGRLLKEDKTQPKYLNSPETLIFEKREMLYNFSKAKSEIRKTGQVFLLEGFMDVIAAFQGNIKNGVASMGTSFTHSQIQLLEKNTRELVICYDGDNPGQQAIFKSLTQLKTSALRLKIVMLPEKLDPDEYLRKYGAESFNHYLLTEQKSPFQFKEAFLKKTYDLDNEQGKADYLKELVQEISTIPSVMERDILLHQLVEKYQVSFDILKSQLSQLTKEQQATQLKKVADLSVSSLPTKKKLSLLEKTEQLLLHRFFHEEDIRQILRQQNDFSFPQVPYHELYLLMDGYAKGGGQMEETSFLNFLTDDSSRNLASSIFLLDVAPLENEAEINDLLQVLKLEPIKNNIQEKKLLQKEAHRLGNKDLELSLTLEIIQLQRQLKTQGIY